MSGGDRPKTRDERLAARLRDNLRRRKQQARAQAGDAMKEAAGDPPLSKPGVPE